MDGDAELSNYVGLGEISDHPCDAWLCDWAFVWAFILESDFKRDCPLSDESVNATQTRR